MTSINLSSIRHEGDQVFKANAFQPKFDPIDENFEKYSDGDSSLFENMNEMGSQVQHEQPNVPMEAQNIEEEYNSAQSSNNSFQSFDYMDFEQNQKRITLANTDLIEPLMSDEDDEFINNPDYLTNTAFLTEISPVIKRRGKRKMTMEAVPLEQKSNSITDVAGQGIRQKMKAQNLHFYLEESQCNEEFEKAKLKFINNVALNQSLEKDEFDSASSPQLKLNLDQVPLSLNSSDSDAPHPHLGNVGPSKAG